MQTLGAISSALLAFSLLTANPSTPPPHPTATAVSSAFAPPANDRVASCAEANYPTPTPPPNAQTPSRSPYGADRDRFAVAEGLQMPSGPSAFDANSGLLPDATSPSLPPPPVRQFAVIETPTAIPNAPPQGDATPTMVAAPTPSTPRRVVIQAGHWQNSDLPWQLAQFDGDGGYANGIAEWKLNLHVATIAADLLRARGYDVRIVPATVPIGCTADAFVALHADADTDPYANGFKAAYPRYINNPANRRFLADMYIEYGTATGLARNTAITLNMSGYYAFYNDTQPYGVNPSTPMLLLEMGYISNYGDAQFLSTQQATAALGVANGVDRFLHGKLYQLS